MNFKTKREIPIQQEGTRRPSFVCKKVSFCECLFGMAVVRLGTPWWGDLASGTFLTVCLNGEPNNKYLLHTSAPHIEHRLLAAAGEGKGNALRQTAVASWPLATFTRKTFKRSPCDRTDLCTLTPQKERGDTKLCAKQCASLKRKGSVKFQLVELV